LSRFERFLPLLQLQSIRKKLVPDTPPEGVMQNALDVLCKHHPVSVEDWSTLINSTPRKFQRLFKQYTGYSPKKMVALYHAYRIAFQTMGKIEDPGNGVVSAYVMEENAKTRIMEYVLSRRSQLFSV
jgi:AraC-like DNA-binding protein